MLIPRTDIKSGLPDHVCNLKVPMARQEAETGDSPGSHGRVAYAVYSQARDPPQQGRR